MALRPKHSAWQRHRAEIHAGAIRPYAITDTTNCCHCNKLKLTTEVNDSGVFDSYEETESCVSDLSRGKFILHLKLTD